MSLIMPKQNEGVKFKLPPTGSHFGTCFRVIDLGTQHSAYYGNSAHKIIISWELPDEKTDDGKPMQISKRYTFSSNKKAVLMKDLQSWRGRDFTDEEYGKFDIGNLIGVNCLLNVTHSGTGDEMYANVVSVGALPKSMKLPAKQEPFNEKIYFSLSDFKQDTFDKLSTNLRDTISKSPEYQMLKLPNHETGPLQSSHDLDDEIPF